MDDRKSTEQLKATTSNSNVNVRTKVNEWVTSFVTEMRSKRPTVVQKLVDSVPSVSTKSFNYKPIETDIISIQSDESSEHELNTISTPKFEHPFVPISISLNSTKLDLDEETEVKPVDSENHMKHEENTQTTTEPKVINAAKFWQKRPTILTTFSKGSLEKFYAKGEQSTAKTIESSTSCNTEETEKLDGGFRTYGRTKINEFYNKLNLSRSKYNLIREQRMEVRNNLEQAKEHLSASANNLNDDAQDDSDGNEKVAMLKICDTQDMDLSLDEVSHLSRSNENVSVEDSLTTSTQSIGDGSSPQHLNVNRKMGIGEIGRSTSDNSRLRNKFHLGDIGRSFSEHQDDEAIVIGERNISAPTSSIAIENNNRRDPNYLERRAYSVSPTQNNVRRGILFRDQSLNDTQTKGALNRGNSVHSDSSRCSSVESLLDARRPDSEAILRQLGFGPVQQDDLLSRIPKRFLKPSQVRGIDTEGFLRQQVIASNIHEQSILGYRGLVGNPHVPPSLIVAKLVERLQMSDERNSKILDVVNDNRPSSAPPTPGINPHEAVE